MKTTIFSVPTILLLVSTAFTPPSVVTGETVKKTQQTAAQQTSGFTFLRTHRQGKGITATWGMASYEDVAGFTIQRTYEDPTDPYANWEDLCLIPCDASRSTSYNDKEVSPGFINYRIVAQMANGSSQVSEISTVRIVSRK